MPPWLLEPLMGREGMFLWAESHQRTRAGANQAQAHCRTQGKLALFLTMGINFERENLKLRM